MSFHFRNLQRQIISSKSLPWFCHVRFKPLSIFLLIFYWFLFYGSFGKYLHTGDFRFQPEMKHYTNDIIGGEGIDCLFLDTTFANPFWEKIPTKVRLQIRRSNHVSCLPRAVLHQNKQAVWFFFRCSNTNQEESIVQIISLIEGCPPTTPVFLECDMLGTEQIILSIFEKYNSLVCISFQNHFGLYHFFGCKLFSTLRGGDSRSFFN